MGLFEDQETFPEKRELEMHHTMCQVVCYKAGAEIFKEGRPTTWANQFNPHPKHPQEMLSHPYGLPCCKWPLGRGISRPSVLEALTHSIHLEAFTNLKVEERN